MKSLIAFLTMTTLAATASAQSNVTIYGTVDAGIGKSNGGTSNNPTTGITNTSNSYQVIQNHASRIGFMGNEDLGAGLAAQFQIEHRFAPDTGAQSTNTMWFGVSYVQLSSTQWGKVYLGRNYTPVFLLTAKIDPFGYDGVGQLSWMNYGNYRTPDVSAPTLATNGRSVTNNSIRASNDVGYISPSFSGFSLHTQGGLSEASGLGRPMSFTVTYDQGPLFVSAGAEKVYGGNYKGQGLAAVGVSYNFGFTRLMAYFGRSSYGARTAANGTVYFTGQALPASLGGGTLNTLGGANITHAKMFSVGAVTPVGGGAIKVGYARANPDGPNNLMQKASLGYDYFLSKRTKLYVEGSYAKEDTMSKSKMGIFGIRHDF